MARANCFTAPFGVLCCSQLRETEELAEYPLEPLLKSIVNSLKQGMVTD